MSQTITPLADRVVAVREDLKTKTASGLYIPEVSQEKSNVAKITAVGPEVTALKVGDTILYKDYATTAVTIDKKEQLILREEDILATISA